MLFTKIILALMVWSLRVDIFLGVPSAGLMVEGSTVKPAEEFSCYQCTTASPSEKCAPEDLKPCQQPADRCLTTISRDPGKPYNVVRECAIGPCQIDNDGTSFLMGDGEHCDVSKPHVNCLLCCRGSGCNTSEWSRQPAILLVSISIVLALLCPVYVI